MNIQEIPFNRLLGIQPSVKDGYILELVNHDHLSNHLGTFHAGALFSLAEATSGEFLLRKFQSSGMNIIPVVRKADIKYSRPVKKIVYATADIAENSMEEVYAGLQERGKVFIRIKVDLFDETNERIAVSNIHWFLALA